MAFYAVVCALSCVAVVAVGAGFVCFSPVFVSAAPVADVAGADGLPFSDAAPAVVLPPSLD